MGHGYILDCYDNFDKTRKIENIRERVIQLVEINEKLVELVFVLVLIPYDLVVHHIRDKLSR
jgi:hypothetical protein